MCGWLVLSLRSSFIPCRRGGCRFPPGSALSGWPPFPGPRGSFPLSGNRRPSLGLNDHFPLRPSRWRCESPYSGKLNPFGFQDLHDPIGQVIVLVAQNLGAALNHRHPGPRRLKAWAISAAMGRPEDDHRSRQSIEGIKVAVGEIGRSVQARNGGIAADEPVAISQFFADMDLPFRSIACSSLKAGAPNSTLAPARRTSPPNRASG